MTFTRPPTEKIITSKKLSEKVFAADNTRDAGQDVPI